MPSLRVQATYTGPLLFITTDQWSHARGALKANFPLRNLHWKPASRPSVRTVQELDVDLVPLDSLREEQSSQIPSTLLDKPLLNMYFLSCDDNDAYKTTAKKQIKDWLAVVSQKKHQEWLVVLVSNPDTQQAGKRLFQMKGSVIDKIRADFNASKRDRCALLTWAPGVEDPAAWADLIGKLKEGLISSFDSNVSLREEEVKRSESQRQMPGWNFSTFFLLKESLASSFEGMNLLEDAQLQFNELEASFYQVLKEKNTSPFPELGGTSPGDDAVPLLSISKKPYRELLLSNTISYADFRTYLLARQCIILGKMGRVTEAARKSTWFINTFSSTWREDESLSSTLFPESWIYTSALSVVSQCQHWAAELELDSSTRNQFNAVKGELLEVARRQLDVIGIRSGHLPNILPFCLSLPPPERLSSSSSDSSTSSPIEPKSKVHDAKVSLTQKDLKEAVSDVEAFDKLYVSTTNRAIECYTASGRRRFALKLHGSLAALELHRSRYSSALSTFSSLPAHYVGTKWVLLEGFMHARSLDCHSQIAQAKDTEWVGTVLAFLKTLINARSAKDRELVEKALNNHDILGHGRENFFTDLLRDLKTSAGQMDQDLTVPNHPLFAVSIAPVEPRTNDDGDGCYLDIIVTNRIDFPISVDRIVALLVGQEQHRLEFTAGPSEIASGDSTVTLFCPDPASGSFLVEMAEIRVAKLIFQWPYKVPAVKDSLETTYRYIGPPLVTLPSDRRAFNVKIRFPREIYFGSKPQILAVVSTGRNHIAEVELRFSSPAKQAIFEHTNGSISQDDVDASFSDEAVVLRNLPPDNEYSLNIPFNGDVSGDGVVVFTHARYTTDKSADLARTALFSDRISGTLPLVVNVQDYFRDRRLISRFTISSDGNEYLRVKQARLESDSESLRAAGCRTVANSTTFVTPAKSANFMFKIDSMASHPREDRESLRFVITYRTLLEEIQAVAQQHLASLITESFPALVGYERSLLKLLIDVLSEDRTWAEQYVATGELRVPFDKASIGWKKAISEHKVYKALSAYDSVPELLGSVLKLLASTHESAPDSDAWRMLTLPVDLPFMNILNAARVQLPKRGQSSIYAGQPVTALVTVKTDFHWGASQEVEEGSEEGFLMRYDVSAELNGAWLVSGPKKGEFRATDGSIHTTYITLIPLRHGSLALPAVSVIPASDPARPHQAPAYETHQIHAGERVEVLPHSARATFVVALPGPAEYGLSEGSTDP